MTPRQLSEQIERLIEGANASFSTSVSAIQEGLYRRMVSILKDLELDSEGFIKQTTVNRRILRQAQGEFDTYISNSNYQSSLEKYLRAVPKVDALNDAYFQTISEAFRPNKQFLTVLRTQLIEDVNRFILQDGLQANVAIPLREIMNTNVNSGGSFSGFLDQLRTFITGGDKEGTLLKYARTYTADVLFNYSRAYQQSITSYLGLEFYLYSGGIIKDSRDFCIDRAGFYFHHNEIESWASMEWQGKRAGTTESSIFIFAGGWSCRHSIIPVHVSIVPNEVIERNVKSGNYKL